jgi:ABC-2 type transport system permease protein
MNTILNIARLHVRLMLQDGGTYVVNFAMPILMMFLLAVAINAEGPTLRLDVIDEDKSELSAALIDQLETEANRTVTVIVCVYGDDDNPEDCDLEDDIESVDDARSRISEGNAAGAVYIPAGFGDSLTPSEEASIEPVEIEYYNDEGLNSATITRNVVQTVVGRFNSSIFLGEVATDSQEGEPATVFANYQEQALDGLTNNPPAQLEAESSGEEIEIGVGANQSVPGIATMFVMIAMLNLSTYLVAERDRGTLQRLMVLPTLRANIMSGIVVGRYVFGLIMFVIFVVVGVFLGVNWGDNYAAIALVSAVYALMVTALGFLLATIVSTAAQAQAISLLMSLTLAPLGGAWFPLDIVPETFQTVAQISPIYWGMEAFQEIIYFGGGIIDVLPMVGVMLLLTAAFLGLAIWRFRYE